MGKQTARAKQCKKISKQRASRQRLRLFARRVGILFSVCIALLAGTTGWSIWSSGKLAKWQQQSINGFWEMTAAAGFSLENVYLTGHHKVNGQTILAMTGVRNGQPILAFSLEEMKQRLEKLPLIRKAHIARNLPHDLRVTVEERQPAAIWQYQRKLQLVDVDGVALGKADMHAPEGRTLPLLVGQMEPRHIREFFAFLVQAPELQKEVESAVLVSERRWNILLKKGIEIKLPEDNLEQAWTRLGELVAQNILLREDIEVIDLRVPDRLFIREEKPLISEAGAQNT